MSASAVALLGFAAWTVALVGVLLLYRTGLVFTGRTKANSWPRGTVNAADPAVIVRIKHAHENTLESLPVFAAIIAAASTAGKIQVTDAAAMYVLYARIAQSVTHIISTSHWFVMVRATFFTIQVALFAYMIWGLLR